MSTIPTYALYGEQGYDSSPDWLHWETVLSRSRLHGFRIAPHRHEQFFQILHLTGGLSTDHITRGLANLNPYIRAWTIQLECEDRNPSDATLEQMAELAKSDPSPVVRLYLASALGRLPLERRWETLANLVAHAEDVADHNLPLMYWYAAEPLAAVPADARSTVFEPDPIRTW